MNTTSIIPLENPIAYEAICDNPYHDCYGKKVEVLEGMRGTHFIHAEKVDNLFNLQIDGGLFRFGLTRGEVQEYIRRYASA